MIKLKYVVCFMLFLPFFGLQAKELKYYVNGVVYDDITKFPVDSVKIKLISAEKGCVDSTFAEMSNVNGRKRSYFQFNNVVSGTYTLQFFHKKYEFYQLPVSVKGQENFISLKNIYLKRKAKSIGAATVKATRIKMVHRGDTIVYDADAFELASGSMLESLIKVLPGVQLKEDGQIFVNGKRVSELLLNGKSFFKNDRLVLLENLPAYMVKNVKVYERNDPMILSVEKPLDMNVVLKKEYAQGWIGNAEIAGGTNKRYLGRLFGLRFTDHSRLSLFGNANNVNDARKPGQDGDWKPTEVLGGQQRVQKAGMDFYVEDSEGRWEFTTTNEVNHRNNLTQTEQTTTTFLPSQDIYGSMQSNQKSKSTHWTTQNNIMMHFGPKDSFVKPLHSNLKVNMSYFTNENSTASTGADMDVPMDSITPYALNHVMSLTQESRWFSHILHRSQAENTSKSYIFSTDGLLDISNSDKPLQASVNWNFNKQNTESFYRNMIEYPTSSSKQDDYRHQYTRTPLKDYNLSGKLGYNYSLNTIEAHLTGEVVYHHTYNSQDRSLFELSRLESSPASLKDLPSTEDSMQLAFDARNSFYGSTFENSYLPKINFQGNIRKNGRRVFNYNLNFPLEITHTNLYYNRNQLHENRNRTTVFFEPEIALTYWSKKTQYVLRYITTASAPSLVYQLNVTDDADPLNIQYSNPDLKSRRDHKVSLQNWIPTALGEITHEITYKSIQNALAMSFLYDPLTGVRTTRPDNVNGNWLLQGNAHYNGTLGKKQRVSLDSHTGYGYLHCVDLTGTTAVERSKVNTLNLNEELSVKYKLGKNEVGMKGKVEWSNIVSDRDNFRSINVTDFSYGLTALIQLPWKFQLNTDLTMYSRRGYESASMNTDDLVWNGRLSRTFLNGSLTCFVDGFDILGNLSNVYRTVNAQGRIETRYNVVPRYIMAHVIYHLNVKPKNRKE